MCYFKDCKVSSDTRVLKRDGIVAYKIVIKHRDGGYSSTYTGAIWKNKRMDLRDKKMNATSNGRGPGIYAYKHKPFIRYYGYSGKVIVKVLLYGRVIEYKGKYSKFEPRRKPGYMAEKAEIIEEVR